MLGLSPYHHQQQKNLRANSKRRIGIMGLGKLVRSDPLAQSRNQAAHVKRAKKENSKRGGFQQRKPTTDDGYCGTTAMETTSSPPQTSIVVDISATLPDASTISDVSSSNSSCSSLLMQQSQEEVLIASPSQQNVQHQKTLLLAIQRPQAHGTIRETVLAPPGHIGIAVDSTERGLEVYQVHPFSPMNKKLFEGDVILAVDDIDMTASSMPYLTLSEFLTATFHNERRLTVERRITAESSAVAPRRVSNDAN